MGCSERTKEIKRRRHRREKLSQLKKKVAKATKSEQGEIARKVRCLTPGADVIVAAWELGEVDR